MNLHCITTMTEQPSDHCYPLIFLILFQGGKSGDKGDVYASEVAFLQKAFSFASSALFCPLRYRVIINSFIYIRIV